MKKNTFNLLNYSVLAGAVISMADGVPDPNIVYTDTDPDISLHTGDSYNLDFNEDGVDDVFFKVKNHVLNVGFDTYWSIDMAIAIPLNANEVPGEIMTWSDWSSSYFKFYVEAKNFLLGESINSAASWEDIPGVAPVATFLGHKYFGQDFFGFVNRMYTSLWSLDGMDSYGNFLGEKEGITAIKFKIGANYHYGWVRLEVNNAAQKMIIKDYAYNSVPGASILAGNTGLDCASPSYESTLNITAASARVNFTSVLGASTYQVKYRKTGDVSWSTKSVNAPKSAVTIGGLDCNSTYEWKVRANCGAAYSVFSALKTFTTDPCREGEVAVLTSVPVFPNPAVNEVSIDMSAFVENNVTMELIDMQGKTVFTNQYTNRPTTIALNDIAGGIYILKLHTTTELYTQKIVVQN